LRHLTGGESLSKYVAKIIDLIDKSGLEYRLSAMTTTVKADVDDVFELIKAFHLKMRAFSRRVITHIIIDDREGAKDALTNKHHSVKEEFSRKHKTL